MKTLYFSLVHSHLIYQNLVWGYDYERLFQLQKRAIRIISGEHFLAHTSPLFKMHNILKLPDIHCLNQLKFYWRYLHQELPEFFYSIPFPRNSDMHDHDTRHKDDFRAARPTAEYNRDVIRNSLPAILNNLSIELMAMCESNNLSSLVNMFKQQAIACYDEIPCVAPDCYSCNYRSRLRLALI